MVNASRKAGLGRTLHRVQRHANDRRNPKTSARHTVEANPDQDNARLNLRSVTAQSNLDEFFEEADLAGKQFVTERRNVAMINEDDSQVNLYDQNERMHKDINAKLSKIELAGSLCVPRRPKWDSNTTPEQLDEQERLTFLTWRKKIATLQDNDDIILTPFEKNLEVWRQLWRVIERSDIVVQILDSRNPLLYLCDDLIKYVDEEFGGTKMNLVLLNKADYLTQEQRKMWVEYFKGRGIKTIFFSALLENENLKSSNKRSSESENNNPDADARSENPESDDESKQGGDDVADSLKNKLNLDRESPPDDGTHVYNKFELLDTWRDLLRDVEVSREKKHGTNQMNVQRIGQVKYNPVPDETSECRPPTVGLVGYPNVGKSSTINALLSAKRVAVSATPGKTKHFQTMMIDRDMMLCDCPGLVFPNFVSSKSEMVINGVLPIDQMKDCMGPVRIIVSRIPRAFFEEIYGLAFEYDPNQNITADDLLNAFGFMRGYMTARGLPDIARAARKVCKDYINGKILYCEPPPDADRKLYLSHSKMADTMKRIEEKAKDPSLALKITERQRRLMGQAKGTDISAREFDVQFFKAQTGGAHIKGLPGIGNMTQPIGQPIGQPCEVKAPKRDKKHKKREKLRRVYRDLDI